MKTFYPAHDLKTPYQIEQNIAKKLVGQGFQEVINNSITTPNYASHSEQLIAIPKVNLLNPLGQELSQMRSSLLFSLLEVIAHNQNRQIRNLRLYEFGKVYAAKDNGFDEKKKLAFTLCGNFNQESWNSEKIAANFYHLKGTVYGLLNSLGIQDLKETQSSLDIFSDGIDLAINKKTIVNIGKVSTQIVEAFGIEQAIYYAEIDFKALFKLAYQKELIVQPIPKFPTSRRDFALLVNQETSFQSLQEAAQKVERKILNDIRLFDVYEGKNLPKGKKSYGLSFHFADPNKTLTDKHIDKVMQKLKMTFEKEFGATLR